MDQAFGILIYGEAKMYMRARVFDRNPLVRERQFFLAFHEKVAREIREGRVLDQRLERR